jgi:hypothetical protein
MTVSDSSPEIPSPGSKDSKTGSVDYRIQVVPDPSDGEMPEQQPDSVVLQEEVTITEPSNDEEEWSVQI